MMGDPAQAAVSQGKGRGQVMRRGLAVALLAVGCGFAFWAGAGFGKKPVSNGGLQIPESSLEFGEIWDSTTFPWTVSIENPTDRDIRVEKFSTSCSCVQIEPQSLNVKAGETATVRLTLNLTAAQLGEGNRAYFSAGLIPHLEGSPGPETGWTIKGRVRKGWLRAEPSLVDFGEDIIKGDKLPTRRVKLLADPAVRDLTPLVDDPDLAVRVTSTSYAGGKSEYEFEVLPRPTLTTGYLTSMIKVRATFANGGQAELAPVTVRGIVRLPVEVIPDPLLLGQQDLDRTVEAVVWLRSIHSAALTVTRVEAPTADVAVLPLAPNASGTEHHYRIRLRIKNVGLQRTTVNFFAQEAGTKTVWLAPLSITYYGSAAGAGPASISRNKD